MPNFYVYEEDLSIFMEFTLSSLMMMNQQNQHSMFFELFVVVDYFVPFRPS